MLVLIGTCNTWFLGDWIRHFFCYLYRLRDAKEARWPKEEFPEVDSIKGGRIIMGCWKRDFSNAQEVAEALSEEYVLPK